MPKLRKPAFSSSGSGITLVEILVALSVASLVMLPIILLFGISEKVTYKSINEVVAANLALQKIEELKSRPFAELRQIIELDAADPIDGPFKEVALPREANGVWNSPGVQYSREARISFYPNVDPDTGSPDFELQKRRIRIKSIVFFLELVQGGKNKPLEKTFELSTIVSDETLGAGLNSSFTPSLPSSNP
ncbi:MAG TPA: hypothetical protein PKM25_15250 [Candidatus Ozemobacteraceae bacterium]|nr:hypothetical protein [Candidatus Ozemobacteraceae bacterium]